MTQTAGDLRQQVAEKISAGYLKTARVALLSWVSETVKNNSNVTDNVDEVEEILGWARQLETLRSKLDVRASVLGGR